MKEAKKENVNYKIKVDTKKATKKLKKLKKLLKSLEFRIKK